jgi:alpha-aminoadipate carrier protein LysW
MARVYCPDCDGAITVSSEVELGQKIICPHCEAELEVISLDPLELDWAYDWSWEEDEEEEDDY